jgi:hypothetical protein
MGSIELHAPTSLTQKLKLTGKGGQFTYTPTLPLTCRLPQAAYVDIRGYWSGLQFSTTKKNEVTRKTWYVILRSFVRPPPASPCVRPRSHPARDAAFPSRVAAPPPPARTLAPTLPFPTAPLSRSPLPQTLRPRHLPLSLASPPSPHLWLLIPSRHLRLHHTGPRRQIHRWSPNTAATSPHRAGTGHGSTAAWV